VSTSAYQHRDPGIDFLRATAVCAVVLYHYTARFSDEYLRLGGAVYRVTYGYLGVNLFFIVSGYCIALTLLRSKDVVTFWSRRFGRLQPAYFICAILTFLAIRWFGLPDRELTDLQAVSNLAWANLVGIVPHLDGAYWSIVVEVKFYILLGLLFWVANKRMDLVHSLWRMLCLAGFGLMAVYAGCSRTQSLAHLAQIPRTLAIDVFLYPYAVYFLGGLAIYRWGETAIPSRLADIAIILAGVVMTSEDWVSKAICAAFFPLALFFARTRSVRIPSPVLFIGLISYPLYLVHQNVGIIIIRELGTYIGPAYLRIALAVLITAAVASVLTLWVEPRLRPLAETIFLQVCGRVSRSARGRVIGPCAANMDPGRD
jgi:peptidoglycan/LPS O-acetylase OafA/YrhL